MYWTDGSVYKGEWNKGIQHGRGVMTFPDGRIKDGLFENNVFKGSMKVAEGSMAEAQIEERKSQPMTGKEQTQADMRSS